MPQMTGRTEPAWASITVESRLRAGSGPLEAAAAAGPASRSTVHARRGCRCVRAFLLGETELSATDVESQAWDLGRDLFQAARYNLLLLNCNHFAAAYVQALGVAPLPGWVNRAA